MISFTGLLGFFCGTILGACTSLAPTYLQVTPTNPAPQCGQVSSIIDSRGRLHAGYVDDTLGGSEPAVQTCAEKALGLTVYAGEYGHDYGTILHNGLVETYPVLDGSSTVPAAPPLTTAVGYIGQSFSWGDNLTDGISAGRCTPLDTAASCAAKYAAPTANQQAQLWCAMKANKPKVVLWYYAGGVPANQVQNAMNALCGSSGNA